MEFIATTISEHIFHEGMLEGKAEGNAEGRAEGRAEGEVKGQIKMLETLYQFGILTEEQFHSMEPPLRQKLAKLAGSG